MIRWRLCNLIALLGAVAVGCASAGSSEFAKPEVDVAAPPAPAAAPASELVARAVVTSGVVEREPVDSLDTVGSDNVEVFFFTEIQDAAGQTLTHRWEYNGEVMAEVPLEIGAARWRTYSSKQLNPGWVGEWTVSVVDGSGNVLSVSQFSYVATEAGTDTAPPASPAPEIEATSPEAPGRP